MTQLRKERARLFWGDLLPYLRLVASSGLALFLFLFVVLGLHFYAELVENLPEGMPIHWVALLCMWPVLSFNSIRTYLQRADIVFLMPAEHRLSGYLAHGLRISTVVQSVVTVFVWAVIWPLYRAGLNADYVQFALIVSLLLVMKWTSLYGRWQELQYVEARHRQWYALGRLVINFVLLYVLFTQRLGLAALIIGLCLLLYIALLRMPRKHLINWTHLIAVEQLHRSRYYAVLSWFVDTPHFTGKIRIRRLLNRIVELLPFEQKYAFHYLYLKTWFRTNLYSLVIRLTVLGCVVIGLVSHSLMKSVLFVFFVYLIGVQLSSLIQQHRYSFWLQVYPLHRDTRFNALAAVIRSIHLTVIGLLTIVLIITLDAWEYVLYSLLIALIVYYVFHRRFKKRFEAI